MLTADLLQYRRSKGRVFPLFLDPGAPENRDAAQALLALFPSALGRTRSEIEEAAGALDLPGLGAKTQRGLLKLLFDSAGFATDAAADPPALRRFLFDASARHWHERGTQGLADWRSGAIASAAAEFGIAQPDVEESLFADLPLQQRLILVPSLQAVSLLHRYNVAQVQGLLLGAQRIEIEAASPSPQRLRQLLRWLKFFGLLFGEEQSAGGGFRMVVDGPLSVLEGSTRYGLNLAEFFPALLLWPPPWRLRALVRLRSGGGLHELVVEPHPHLHSHYPDQGQWVPDSAKRFVEEFNRLGRAWRAEPADELLMLPGNRYLVPDFVLRHPDRPQPVMLEHLLHPDPEFLPGRIALARLASGVQYVLACRATPALKQAVPDGQNLYLYRRNLTPSTFLDWLEGRSPRRAER
jgi:predicted nuclease of restriction endonuclease-like RecB superfamily